MRRVVPFLFVVLAWTSPLPAQDVDAHDSLAPPTAAGGSDAPAEKKPMLRVLATGQWWDGDYTVVRASGGLSYVGQLDRTTKLVSQARLDWDKYNFDNGGGITPDGSEPWDLIYSAAVSIGLDTQWNDEIGTVFGGLVQASWQDGAKVEDAIRGGGFAEVRYTFSRDLTLGGGLTVISRLEERVIVIPRFVVDWKLTNELSLTSFGAGIPNFQGMELLWKPGGGWSLGFGAGFFYKEFRLDDDGNSLGQNGVGREDGMPLWFQVTKADSNGTVTGFVGFGSGIDTRMDDDNGNWIGDTDPGTTLIIGLQASLRF